MTSACLARTYVGAQTTKGTSGLTPIVAAALFLEAMTVSITAIAIPNMQTDLGVPLTLLQWTHGAFIVGFAGLLMFGGRVADIFGRRRVFLIAVALFGLAALTAALAPTLDLRFAARGLQGAAAAFMIPASVSILTEAFPEGPQRNRALSTFNAAGAAGFTAGLIVGGLVIEAFGWRWSFGLNAPAAAVILAAGLILIPSSTRAIKRPPLDLGGAAMITVAVMLSTLGLTWAAEHGATIDTILIMLGAISAGAAFLWIERRHPAPLLPLSLFRSPRLRRANLASLTMLGSFFGFNLLVSLALQGVQGFSATMTGLALLPMGLLCVVVAQFATPRLMDRFGAGRVATSGLASLALSAASLAVFGDSGGLGIVVAASLLAGGIGMGLAYAPLAISAVASIGPEHQGVAAGLQQTALQVGGVLGIALAVAGTAIAHADTGGFAVAAIVGALGAGISWRLP